MISLAAELSSDRINPPPLCPRPDTAGTKSGIEKYPPNACKDGHTDLCGNISFNELELPIPLTGSDGPVRWSNCKTLVENAKGTRAKWAFMNGDLMDGPHTIRVASRGDCAINFSASWGTKANGALAMGAAGIEDIFRDAKVIKGGTGNAEGNWKKSDMNKGIYINQIVFHRSRGPEKPWISVSLAL
ncbi:uncharacterized protein PG998_007102 [Apiospora kogelbergensis]|uniref:uncharacterized protein n=1 Tax=Apiospora kogelbergensis TaxID=1337665 RepID=UPI00312F7186